MSKLTRIAIVDMDKCKPKKCNQECKKYCPVVKIGKKCIEVSPTSKISFISEILCNGCGICTKKCPYEAITIINLPKDLDKDVIFRYSMNSFKLHRLPTPRLGKVLGLVGTNGIGKSTVLKILGRKLVPNFGEVESDSNWQSVISHFQGSELQKYFTKLVENEFRAIIKPQYVNLLSRAISGIVEDILQKKDEKNCYMQVVQDLELNNILQRNVKDLSGGELQRFAIALTVIQKATIYMFDEPTSYLDVHQRLLVAKTIRKLIDDNTYILVVEHDLAVLDYLSDYICCLYGKPGAYGVVTLPYGVREGINVFLDGFIPTENMRFRDYGINFKLKENIDEEIEKHRMFKYPTMKKVFENFELNVKEGNFTDSEIIVLLGENGTGKSTFIKMLAGYLKPDNNIDIPEMFISYKPQTISPKFKGTVQQLFETKIKDTITNQRFKDDVIKPMDIDRLLDQPVLQLSGGELQRVAIVLALGKPADIYLIDEPSTFLDSEQRIVVSKIIKRFILNSKKTAFIVEHDFIMSTYLADRVITFSGKPSIKCTANEPNTLMDGMNIFLKSLDVTFRRDPGNFRPRINKLNSIKDKEQKQSGNYFFIE